VVVVINPGTIGFSPEHIGGALIAVSGAIVTAGISIAVRDLGRTEPAVAIVFWFSLLSSALLAVAVPFFAESHSPAEWLVLIFLGLSGGLGQLALTGALRQAPVSAVLPMDYSGLLWSILLGYWLFADKPAASTWLGAPLIVVSGLLILWREQRGANARNQEVPT
jgi:drug/metabolite transporter (DMT)-like permease